MACFFSALPLEPRSLSLTGPANSLSKISANFASAEVVPAPRCFTFPQGCDFQLSLRSPRLFFPPLFDRKCSPPLPSQTFPIVFTFSGGHPLSHSSLARFPRFSASPSVFFFFQLLVGCTHHPAVRSRPLRRLSSPHFRKVLLLECSVCGMTSGTPSKAISAFLPHAVF